MTKQEFIDLFGEDPEDMFGPDWENELAEWDEDESHQRFGGCVGVGPCFSCRDGF